MSLTWWHPAMCGFMADNYGKNEDLFNRIRLYQKW